MQRVIWSACRCQDTKFKVEQNDSQTIIKNAHTHTLHSLHIRRQLLEFVDGDCGIVTNSPICISIWRECVDAKHVYREYELIINNARTFKGLMQSHIGI